MLALAGLFHGCFAGALPSFEYNFSSLFLTFITRVYSEILYSSVSLFVETSYCDSTAWLPRDPGSGCGKSRNRLLTIF